MVTSAQASQIMTKAGPMSVQLAVMGLNMPTAFEFLPVQGMLLAERSGRLMLIDGGHVTVLSNVPDVLEIGQGGLLDVLVPRDFEHSREIFLAYSVQQIAGEGTAMARAILPEDPENGLQDVRQIFEMAPGTDGRQHFGSRLAEGRDGTLFMTLGDRGDASLAQDLTQHAGKVIRINKDGSIPVDNPYVDLKGALPEIWSIGHRNPQGAIVDLAGRLWITEHGPQGGDEVNLIKPGRNYGWPLITYGLDYDGSKIGVGQSLPGMEQPVHFWDPSIAPSSIALYESDEIPEWHGNAFVGSLKMDYLIRLEGVDMHVAEQIVAPEIKRVRDVAVGPDGAVWFLSEANGALYRIAPARP